MLDPVAELEEALGRELGVPVSLTPPPNPQLGDLATPVALRLAKERGLPPAALAEEIAELALGMPQVASAEAKGGFVNIKLAEGVLFGFAERLSRGERVFRDRGAGRRVLYEFVSANPTGPLNVVSGRAAAVGDTLVRLARAHGFSADAEYYVNDAGGQIRALGESVLWFMEHDGEPDDSFPKDGYRGDYVRELAKELGGQGDAEALGRAAAEAMLEGIKEDLRRFGVEMAFVRESDIRKRYDPGLVKDKLRPYLAFEGGAELFRVSEIIGGEKDRVLRKSTGEYTYFFWDLVYHLNKRERGYERMVNLLGPDHHGYAPRMLAGLKVLLWPDAEVDLRNLRLLRGDQELFKIILVQQVHLVRGGQRVKMSKRAGTYYTLRELLDEVGRDAARFFFLMRSPDAPLDFDVDLAKTLSVDNPVYYVQYTHARCASLRAFAGERGIRPKMKPDLLRLPEERELALLVALWPQTAERALLKAEPHHITQFLLRVAGAFHSYYQRTRIITDHAPLSAARLSLAEAIRNLVAQGLWFLGVSAPEKM